MHTFYVLIAKTGRPLDIVADVRCHGTSYLFNLMDALRKDHNFAVSVNVGAATEFALAHDSYTLILEREPLDLLCAHKVNDDTFNYFLDMVLNAGFEQSAAADIAISNGIEYDLEPEHVDLSIHNGELV